MFFFDILLGKWYILRWVRQVPKTTRMYWLFSIWSAWVCWFGAWKMFQTYAAKWWCLSRWWFQPTWKNISQNWNLLQIGVNIKNIWNHHLVMVIWYLVWNNPLKTSMSLSLCICQTSLWDSSLEGREKYLLFGFFLFISKKNLHPVANSSNKETNSTDFLTWSWHISIIFGWQTNTNQTCPQSTELRHLSTATVFIFAWYVCLVLLPWFCFITFRAPDITLDVSKKRRKMWETPGWGCCKPWNLIIFPRVIAFWFKYNLTSFLSITCFTSYVCIMSQKIHWFAI